MSWRVVAKTLMTTPQQQPAASSQYHQLLQNEEHSPIQFTRSLFLCTACAEPRIHTDPKMEIVQPATSQSCPCWPPVSTLPPTLPRKSLVVRRAPCPSPKHIVLCHANQWIRASVHHILHTDTCTSSMHIAHACRTWKTSRKEHKVLNLCISALPAWEYENSVSLEFSTQQSTQQCPLVRLYLQWRTGQCRSGGDGSYTAHD